MIFQKSSGQDRAIMFKSLACLLLVALAATGINGDEPEKLVGAKDTLIDVHPYVASIRYKEHHMCGGAIIAPRFILTAAHCVEPHTKKFDRINHLNVLVGTDNLKSGGTRYAVKALHYHPMYIASPGYHYGGYDVGIYELAEPIKYNKHALPIALPTTRVPAGIEVTVAAWGATGFPNGVLSDHLQELQLKTIGLKECRKMMLGKVHDLEFCTFVGEGIGTCKGDSGSPLVHEGKVVGVVSNGLPCAAGYPDVHTDIALVRKFIDDTLAQ